MNKILDVFYNQIINEAAKGEIDAFLKYNIVFSTEFVEENKRIEASSITDEVIIPTLKITDKENFDKQDSSSKAFSISSIISGDNPLEDENT